MMSSVSGSRAGKDGGGGGGGGLSRVEGYSPPTSVGL